ncbi:hypothetical protein V1506DRAFT_522806 [Lipomyces tetrasporus]
MPLPQHCVGDLDDDYECDLHQILRQIRPISEHIHFNYLLSHRPRKDIVYLLTTRRIRLFEYYRLNSTMVKSVLITGCSEGGIGDYLARDLHNRGLKVFTSARDLKKVEHLKTLGLNVLALDVTSSESVEAGVREVRSAAGGTLDILVNNSESAYSIPVLDTDLNIAKKMFDVNLFCPLLTAAKGKIVNLGSIVGAFPASFMGTYNASKAAENLLSDNLRIEVAPFGVQVVTVSSKLNYSINQPPVELPNNSVYSPIKSKILVWCFIIANLVLTTFFKHTFLDGKLAKDGGLTELKALLENEKSG